MDEYPGYQIPQEKIYCEENHSKEKYCLYNIYSIALYIKEK